MMCDEISFGNEFFDCASLAADNPGTSGSMTLGKRVGRLTQRVLFLKAAAAPQE
jgi:hypothetical protein